MDRDELTRWALASGWRMIGAHPSLVTPAAPKEAVARMVLKATGVDLQIRKPGGRWEKVAGEAYVKIHPDPVTGAPMNMGLGRITGFARLMAENKAGKPPAEPPRLCARGAIPPYTALNQCRAVDL